MAVTPHPGQIKTYKEDFPPKPQMEEICERLLIGPFYTSKGGTARTDFFEAVAEQLGVKIPRNSQGGVAASKQTVAGWAWRQLNSGMPPTTGFSKGSKVTNELIDGILDGLRRRGVDYRLKPPAITPPVSPATVAQDLTDMVDSRKKITRVSYAREGQPGFRAAVMAAYDETCCMTGTRVLPALQAAHIVEYRGTPFNHVTNGLALRGDVHTLYDRGLLAIHETSLKILVKDELQGTDYGALDGRTITVPASRSEHPDPRFLRAQRIGSGFPLPGDPIT